MYIIINIEELVFLKIRGDYLNSYSHLHVSAIILKKLKSEYGICLPAVVFSTANCRPDYSIKYKRHPHYKDDMYGIIQQMLRELAQSNKAKMNRVFLADRLGVICHYLCDFFCYAHTERFQGGLKEHIRYEAELNHYIKQRRHICESVNFLSGMQLSSSIDDVLQRLDDHLQDYYSLSISCGFDMVCAIQACMEVLVQMLYIVICKRQLNAKCILEPSRLLCL